MTILTEKEIKDVLGDISDNTLVVEFEKLWKNVNNFYKLFSKKESRIVSAIQNYGFSIVN